MLLMTIGLFAAGTYGLYFLKQDFDFNRFLPKESAAKQYLKAKAVVRFLELFTFVKTQEETPQLK